MNRTPVSRILLLALLWMVVAMPSRAEIGVISPAEAKRLIESTDPKARPLVLDTRGGYKDYFRGHIPTAHHINFDTLRGTENDVPVQYLPKEITRPLLVRAGVDKDRLHLIYATGDTLPNDEILSASMVAFVLEKYGVSNIRIIDGGLPGWVAAGFEPTQEYFGNPPGHLPRRGNPEIAIALDELLAIKDRPGVLLLDARPKEEYLGQDKVWLRKGHIPGAVSFHWARLMEKNNTHQFRPLAEVKAELVAAGITPDKEIVAYCGTSREGSLVRFYLKHVAGYPRVRLYEGAWKEYVWARGKSLPAETRESIAR